MLLTLHAVCFYRISGVNPSKNKPMKTNKHVNCKKMYLYMDYICMYAVTKISCSFPASVRILVTFRGT